MPTVRWYLRYSLSYRDVEELLAERGIVVDHVSVYRWVRRRDSMDFGRYAGFPRRERRAGVLLPAAGPGSRRVCGVVGLRYGSLVRG